MNHHIEIRPQRETRRVKTCTKTGLAGCLHSPTLSLGLGTETQGDPISKLCPDLNHFWASRCNINRNLGQTRLPSPLDPTRIAVKRDLLATQVALNLLQILLKLGERCGLASKIRQ